MARKTFNPIEFDGLKNIHKTLFKDDGFPIKKFLSIGDPIEDFDFKVLYDIYKLGFKYWKGQFKQLLIEHQRITKDIKYFNID